jgi:hypothetical protein
MSGSIEAKRKLLLQIVFTYAAYVSAVWDTFATIHVENEADLVAHFKEQEPTSSFQLYKLYDTAMPLISPRVFVTDDIMKTLSRDAHQMFLSLSERTAVATGDLAFESALGQPYDEDQVPVDGSDDSRGVC